MEGLLEKLKSKKISQRSFIATIKKSESYINEVINETAFLNEYNPDILERIYYIINDIHETIKCPYCQNKAKWTNRINEGYKTTCCSKECESKRISEQKQGLTNISENRDKQFIDWQSNVDEKEINDEFIKDNIKYDKQINLLTNPFIKSYLENRFKDSSSLLESYQRIVMGIEEKPKCPVCGKPVTWLGKRTKLVTTYCSSQCSNSADETILKKKQTQLQNWGTANCYDSDKYKKKMLNEYGVEYMAQRNDVKEKRKKTLIEKYGTDKLFSVEEIRNKVIETTRKHYGVDFIFQSEEVRQKMYEACKEASKLQSSKDEDRIYGYFLDLGLKPERLYRSEKFPFCVDFYLKEFDMYIEYQGSQYHNGRAFLGTQEDIEELNILKDKNEKKKAETGKDSQYNSIINTWTIFDVKKRNYAKEHNINFLEIYKCTCKEDLQFQLYLLLRCINKLPIFNFSNELLKESFNKFKALNKTDLSGRNNDNIIIKQFQNLTFYKQEMEIYASDPVLRRKLIQNRCKYLNKKENELTVNDIITGFKKSAIYYGYSHFNPGWTNWFVNNFNIKSVYDPCGGWGHHFLGMLNCDKIIYNDLSKSTYNGVVKMKDYFHIDNLECHCEDGKTFIPDNVDAWFMCPPYYNLEHYECGDFDSIDEYKGFLNDIFELWNKSTAKIFGLIIREDLVNLINYVYSYKYDLNITNVSYISGGKRFKEYFYIFKK